MHSYGHTLGKNPTYVTGADTYRTSYAFLLTPGEPDYEAMVETLAILPGHERPDGYGVVLAQSEEHSVTFIGPRDHVAQVREGRVPLDKELGYFIEFWPNSDHWDKVIPANTWNPDGAGIFREFDHKGTSVLVYEYVEDRDGTPTPMVGWHCLSCHRDDLQRHHPNRGPMSRRWMAGEARKHLRRADDCRPADPRMAAIVNSVANEMHGTNNPVTSYESYCSTTGRCGQIRHLRATAAARA
jgi:hypothetical protein